MGQVKDSLCGRQSLKKFKRADHVSNFLKAVFLKFYLVHSWILCPIWTPFLFQVCTSFFFFLIKNSLVWQIFSHQNCYWLLLLDIAISYQLIQHNTSNPFYSGIFLHAKRLIGLKFEFLAINPLNANVAHI